MRAVRLANPKSITISEYSQTPEIFTQESDAVNAAVAKVAPGMKFLGLGELQGASPDMFSHFLNASNHAPGAPLSDAIDYHFYAQPPSRTDVTTYHSMFAGEFSLSSVTTLSSDADRCCHQTLTALSST